jgi:hypothetical protein
MARPSRRMGDAPRRLRNHAADRGRLRRRNHFRSLDSASRHHLRGSTDEYPVIITADDVQAASIIIRAFHSAGGLYAPVPPTGSAHGSPPHAICRCSTDRCPVRSAAGVPDAQSRGHDHNHRRSTSHHHPPADHDSPAADHDSPAADHDSPTADHHRASAADPNLIATTVGGHSTAQTRRHPLCPLTGRVASVLARLVFRVASRCSTMRVGRVVGHGYQKCRNAEMRESVGGGGGRVRDPASPRLTAAPSP